MPVHEYTPKRPDEYNDLVSELAAEWKVPSQSAEPEILLERDQRRRIVHVYVIWSKWVGVDRVLRSEIVMDAAARALPEDDVPNIIVAMGLTPEEVDRSGIGGATSKFNGSQRP